MNRKILEKCINELNSQETIRVDYIRGMLETLIETLPEEKVYIPPVLNAHIARVEPSAVNTDGRELDIVAENRLAEIKRMAGDVR